MENKLLFVRNLFILFLGVFIWFKIIIWVNQDAKKRRFKSQLFWATLALFFNIFGLAAYLLFKIRKKGIKCDYCGFDFTKELSETNLSICPNCKRLLHSEAAHEIFFNRIRDFDPRRVEIFNYEGFSLTQTGHEHTASEMWNIVKFYMDRAVRNRATDIHFDPEKENIRVRQRIDGILYDVVSPPKELGIKLTATIKAIAGLDIAQKRVPQSGRFDIKVSDKRYDLRISISHAIFGEKIAIRILDRGGELLKLEKLGFFEDELRQIEKILFKPNGMILICGPTGCGKTTTLYSILKKINPEKRNIMTIEDPVEYELPGMSQQQINVRAGVDFASGLRSILRQDPDVIMVGEIRDAETARIANQAADTGHLVLSTMHSIDAANVVTRLRDLDISSHHLSSSLLVVIAQRLIRTLCNDCKEKIRSYTTSEDKTPRNTYVPKGCLNCSYTGYRGRTGIFEMLVVSEELRDLIYRDASPDVIRNNYAKWGIENLRQKGIKKVLNGETTLEELDTVVSETKSFTKEKT